MAMNNSSELMLEALLRAGASASDSAFMRRIDELDAETPDAPPSKEREKKIGRLLRRVGRKDKRRVMTKFGKVVAAALIIALAGLGIVTIGVDALRSVFMNFYHKEGTLMAEITYSGDGIPTGNYLLSYIPQGFELEKDETNVVNTHLTYKSAEGDWFEYNSDPYKLDLDAEAGKGTAEEVIVNGSEARFITTKDKNILIWYNGYNDSCIFGSIPKNEMIKIAEGAVQDNGIVRYQFSYVPDGFALETKEYGSVYSYYRYVSPEGDHYFDLHADPLAGQLDISTFRATTIDHFKIDGFDAVLILREDGDNSLTWCNRYNSFTMFGNISKDELIKIAENIEITR